METKRHYAYFSAAIRDGAKLRPQNHDGGFFTLFDMGGRGSSCAMGAGYEAATGKCEPDAWAVIETLRETFPYFLRVEDSVCPLCSEELGPNGLYGQVMHLNDDHKWTREAIADWLYAEEEKLGFVTLVETEPSPELSLQTQTAINALGT